MKIVNPTPEDFHVHTLNFSDGFNTIYELVQFAGKIGLERMALTDHSQVIIDRYDLARKGFRQVIERWKNVHNDTQVLFGIEGDILNQAGDICSHIQEHEADYLILSLHPPTFKGLPENMTRAYVNAIKRHHERIEFICHPCMDKTARYVDMKELVKAANDHGIPLEVNGANMMNKKTNYDKLEEMLSLADQIMVNSDAHVLYELEVARDAAFDYLKKQGALD